MRFRADYSDALEKAYVEDGIFENDARLYINGDFGSVAEEVRYANRIATLLNKAVEHDPELKWK